jgi:vacuolar protein sorting-associated protein 13A/C
MCKFLMNRTMAVNFSSKAKLEFNVSQASIQVLVKTLRRWRTKQLEIGDEGRATRGVHSPYIIINRTGYDLQIWGEKGDDLKSLRDGQEIPWRFGDWRERSVGDSNRISIQLAAEWESVKWISVDREGVEGYVLRPMVDEVSHKLVAEVKLRDNVKVVVLRSALVFVNMTEIELEVVTINEAGKITSKVHLIKPGEEFGFGIEASYWDRVLVRPMGFGFHWSREVLYWRELQRDVIYPLISCESPDPGVPTFMFQINSVFPTESAKGYVMVINGLVITRI